MGFSSRFLHFVGIMRYNLLKKNCGQFDIGLQFFLTVPMQ